VLYKYGRKLVRDRTVKSRLLRVRVSKSQFADAVNCTLFESAGRKFVQMGVSLVLLLVSQKLRA